MSKSRLPSKLRTKITEQFRSCCAFCQTQTRISGIRLTVDHIVPESLGGTNIESNLCLACWDCNLHKGVQVTAIDAITLQPVRLFHPQQQLWSHHFKWSEDKLLILPITATGRVTIDALQLNRAELTVARSNWLVTGLHPPNHREES
mgnify:CR=1 FL=1